MKKVKNRTISKPEKRKRMVIKPRIEKTVRKRKPKEYDSDQDYEDNDSDSSYFYDEDEDNSYRKAIAKEIREELEDCLSLRSDFTVIELNEDWCLVARFVNLKVNITSNQNGFQPLEKIVEAKKCILCIIQYGEEPKRGDPNKNGRPDIGHLAYILKKKGCQVLQLNSKYDVNGKLNEI